MLSNNEIITIALSVIGGIVSAIISACGVIWGLIKLFLDIKIEKAIQKYDEGIIQVRCKDHKIESRSDLNEIKESQKLAREEQKETSDKIFSLINEIKNQLLDIARNK